jgi:hypothetical protein
MNIHKDCIHNGEVAGLQQIILALQHQPQLNEKILFSLEIKVTEVADTEEYWKTDPAFLRWFNKPGGRR